MMREKTVRFRPSAPLRTFAVILAIFSVWQVVTGTGLVSIFLLPSPVQIAAAFPKLFVEEGLLWRLVLTAGEVVAAAGIAILLGGVIGWTFYQSADAWRAFSGWVVGLNAAPTILLYPLLMVFFGRGSGAVIFLGALGGLPSVILKTRESFASVPPVLINVGRSFNLAPTRLFVSIHLPAAAPVLAAGIRLGVAYATVAVIGAEFLTGSGGLGALIPDLADRYQLASMYGTILVVIFTSGALVAAMKRVERWLWQN